MAIVKRYEKDANFWTVNQQIASIEAFDKFCEKDTSVGKVESSEIMWAIALVYDYESDYRKIQIDDRIDVIEKDFLKKPGFFTKKAHFLTPLIDAYNKLQHSSPRRVLAEWEEGMDKRTDFLKTASYNLATGKELDAMRAMTKKLFDDLQRIKEDIEKTEGASNIQGGASLSLLEGGEL